MPDGWEVTNGLSPTVANRFEDADGDRYPNVFEYFYGTDPNNRASLPTPTYVVNGAGGGTHTTISAALGAANVGSGAYQIIGIAPGTYSGPANLRDVTIPSTKPTLLFIGLQGAAKTIIDGGLANYGWWIQASAVVSSLTFQKSTIAFYVDSPTAEVRFVDLMVRDNIGPSWAGGVHVNQAAKVHIASSSFVNNTGSSAQDVWAGQGATTMVSSLFWGNATGTRAAVNPGYATLATSYCFAKGQTLSGTGNLAGTTNPKLRSDFRLRASSPLRGAGISGLSSRIDLDGELRPSSAPDMGVDQFLDADGDSLPDSYELAVAGNLTSIVGSADTDGDELSNAGEYDYETNRLDSDTDNDGVWDGVEVAIGTNPLVADADDLFGDLNYDGIIDSIGAQLGRQPDQLDSDGDSVSNANEILMCTNPLRSDTDGDGYPDNTDAFRLDPRLHALPTNPADTTAPIITLTAPWYAVLQ